MKKIDGHFQVTIALDISDYVKLNALSIKIISRNLNLLVLQISAVFEVRYISPSSRISPGLICQTLMTSQHELWVN